MCKHDSTILYYLLFYSLKLKIIGRHSYGYCPAYHFRISVINASKFEFIKNLNKKYPAQKRYIFLYLLSDILDLFWTSIRYWFKDVPEVDSKQQPLI